MKAQDSPIKSILEGSKSFIIPIFQRGYRWTSVGKEKDLTVGKFWEDLRSVIQGDETNHFFGSLVTQSLDSNASDVTKYIIIDGQQRMITTVLLLCALRDTCDPKVPEELEESKTIDDNYIKNVHRKGDNLFKIIPSSDERENFFAIVELPEKRISFPELNRNNFGKVYNYYKSNIKELLSENSEGTRLDNIKKIVNAILNQFVIVDVKLDANEDPYSVFESLNTTGMDLTNWDLIKNYILMKFKDQEYQKQMNDQYFYEIENVLDNIDRTKIKDEFMRHFLGSYGIITTSNKIYSTTKNSIESEKLKSSQNGINTYENFMIELKRVSKYYAKIYNPDLEEDDEIRLQLSNLKQFPYTVHYPLLIEIFRSYENQRIDQQTMSNAIKFIETYILRKVVTDQRLQGLNKLFPTLSEEIKNVEEHQLLPAIQEKLSKGNYIIPSDGELKMAIKTNKLDKDPDLAKYILYNIERSLNKEVGVLSMFQLEHIFPQNPDEDCKSYYAEDFNEFNDTLKHLLGNLTLTAYNSELSNKSFDEKLNMTNGYMDSGLKITRGLSNYDKWNKQSYEERNEWLYSKIIEIWPISKSYVC